MENKAVKNMEYWKNKNNIPGIEALADSGLTDGRAGSSPFQIATPGSSPNKNMIKKALGFMNPLSGGPLGAGIRALAPNSQMAQGMTDPFGFQGGGGAGAMFGGMAGGAAPEENPMAAVPMQTPMAMESPMKQEEGPKTIAGQDIIKGEGEDEGNFYYQALDGDQIFIEDPDGVIAKNFTDGMVSDLDFSFEQTEDGYYKVTGVAGEGGEQPVRPEDVVPSMNPGGVGQ